MSDFALSTMIALQQARAGGFFGLAAALEVLLQRELATAPAALLPHV